MFKKRLQLFLFILSIATYQYSFAHGGGGSGGSSYDFDKKDLSAERHAEKKMAEKKAAEKKQDKDTWADFMKSVNTPSNENHSEKSHDHGDSASTE